MNSVYGELSVTEAEIAEQRAWDNLAATMQHAGLGEGFNCRPVSYEPRHAVYERSVADQLNTVLGRPAVAAVSAAVVVVSGAFISGVPRAADESSPAVLRVDGGYDCTPSVRGALNSQLCPDTVGQVAIVNFSADTVKPGALLSEMTTVTATLRNATDGGVSLTPIYFNASPEAKQLLADGMGTDPDGKPCAPAGTDDKNHLTTPVDAAEQAMPEQLKVARYVIGFVDAPSCPDISMADGKEVRTTILGDAYMGGIRRYLNMFKAENTSDSTNAMLHELLHLLRLNHDGSLNSAGQTAPVTGMDIDSLIDWVNANPQNTQLSEYNGDDGNVMGYANTVGPLNHSIMPEQADTAARRTPQTPGSRTTYLDKSGAATLQTAELQPDEPGKQELVVPLVHQYTITVGQGKDAQTLNFDQVAVNVVPGQAGNQRVAQVYLACTTDGNLRVVEAAQLVVSPGKNSFLVFQGRQLVFSLNAAEGTIGVRTADVSF